MRALVAVMALSQCPICWKFWYSQLWPFFKTMWANVLDMCWASEVILGGNCLFERVGHQQWCIHHASWISISWILAVKTDIMFVQILCNCGPFCVHGEDVGCQLIDIALRVELVRRDTVKTSWPRPSGKMNLLPPDASSAIHCKVFFVQLHGWLWRMWRYTWACWDCASTRYLAAACGHVISIQSLLKVFLLFATDCYHSFSIKYRMMRIWGDCNC